MSAPRIDASSEGAVLWVRVQPRAKRCAVRGTYGEALKVALRPPPVDRAANAALLKFLGRLCEVPPSSLALLSGHGGRSKRVVFRTLDSATLTRRIEEALEG